MKRVCWGWFTIRNKNRKHIMSQIRCLLRYAGFSKWFCQSLESRTDLFGSEGSEQKGYMVVIDEANLLRFVLEDFTAHGKDLQALSYTNISLESLRENEEIEDPSCLRTRTVGPGLHGHSRHPLVFCYENADIVPLMTSGIHKYVNRAAIVSCESMEVITQYLQELQRKNEEEEKLKIFVCQDLQWSQQKVSLRKKDTVFLEKRMWEELYGEAKDFFSAQTKQFYRQHGLPYVRTFMFHGDPGCGKSSCIKALASELKTKLYSLNLAMARMDDMSLISLMNDVQPGSIVAIEDIDRVFDNFSVNQTASSISFSTLLNILDGTLTREGVVIVMTCNDFRGMDDAIKRCGRVDRVYKFGNATPNVMERMFLSFYPEKKAEAKKFVSQVKQVSRVPVATVTEFFVRNRKRKAEDISKDVDTTFFTKRRKTTDREGAVYG